MPPSQLAAMNLSIPVLALLALAAVSSGPLRAGSLYDIPVRDIDGKSTTLAPYRGQVVLIVNVASECGYTPQYRGLEALYRKFQGQGLVILGFPCNQFGGQEPGSNAQIKQFCTSTYQVSFPLFDKIEVNGPGRHPLYVALAGKASPFPGDITWNFNKFLIGRDGRILERFDSDAEPESPPVVKAIAAALAAK
jgi:glutathione peroxidase